MIYTEHQIESALNAKTADTGDCPDKISSSLISRLSRSTMVLFVICFTVFTYNCAGGKSSKDDFINNPFPFEIQKNISDDYNRIGSVVTNTIECPLKEENIKNPAFCVIRTIEYDDMTVRVFSFDVAMTGTAEYILHGPGVKLKNGLSLLSSKRDILRSLGNPWKKEDTGNDWIWRSHDQKSFLIFSFSGDKVTEIRWHENKDVTYLDVRVWETRH